MYETWSKSTEQSQKQLLRWWEKVYDESQEAELLGLEKADIKYQVSEGIFEGEKNQLFSIFFRRPNKAAFLGLWLVLQPESCTCVQGALA